MLADPDILFASGCILVLVAFPALLSAFSQSRAPTTAATLSLLAAGMIVTAVIQRPDAYSVSEAPSIVADVINRYVN